MNRFALRAARAGLLAAELFCLSSVGCEATDEVENRITCANVYNRYQKCFDDDYNVSTCVDRCEDDATADEEKEQRLETCEACINDESCASAVFECSADCAQFVP